MKRREFVKKGLGVVAAVAVAPVLAVVPEEEVYFEGMELKFTPAHTNTGSVITGNESNGEILIISNSNNGDYDGEYIVTNAKPGTFELIPVSDIPVPEMKLSTVKNVPYYRKFERNRFSAST